MLAGGPFLALSGTVCEASGLPLDPRCLHHGGCSLDRPRSLPRLCNVTGLNLSSLPMSRQKNIKDCLVYVNLFDIPILDSLV